jgi:hypothetical protein
MTLNAAVFTELHPTAFTKNLIATEMFRRSVAFMEAARLLRESVGAGYVVLHIECQAIELLLKSLLLAVDYDRFWPQLKKISHHLDRAADALTESLKMPAVSGGIRAQLLDLTAIYSKSIFRYSGNHDILIGHSHLGSDRVRRRFFALLRLVARKRVFVVDAQRLEATAENPAEKP